MIRLTESLDEQLDHAAEELITAILIILHSARKQLWRC
jgi:hypothetical protein